MTVALDAGHDLPRGDRRPTASAVAVGDEVAVQADGGRFTIGGDGQQGSQGADPGTGGSQDLTANDVTVPR